ncbi:polysaccharide deacetylase family protein [Colwellia psychrerythraea]|uniref:Polysaccharide deacetylase n=1 Tax=Colwellia psychrerythraea TaxID=28229 RepID=A0A099L5K1_COLPS|nr:polysaccharide deacetylase family protein [Colwellia psychrerythraea]KGJ97457.1 polysaccharide deacetylase [Colwellia psychrerythraea]
MKYMLRTLFSVSLLLAVTLNSHAAVILQYHHVSDTTPASTSISPKQFEVHLQYLKDNNFKVVPLSELVEGIKKQQPLPDKSVAITFDDAYTDVLTQAKPILNKFSFPYTIYVNPGIINRNESKSTSPYLSWIQLKALADEGVIIANHGYEHDSMVRIAEGVTQAQWLKKQTQLLLKAEAIIKDNTGQSWRYYAYPYGEYDLAVQAWAKENDFVAFSQQSGAIDLTTDLTSVPRFPASKPYDKISGLRDKLNSLAFNIRLEGEQAETIFKHKKTKSITFAIETGDFYKSALNCYISGLGKQKITWNDDKSFSINFSKDLPVGRVRANCTAASISKPGRYYWYSKPWFILKDDGSWYHL